MTAQEFDLKQALLDPSSVFASPEELAARADIETEVRIEILRRWEYDAAETSVAVEEGMPDGDDGLLARITEALSRLAGDVDVDHSPPTKHGGIPRSSLDPKR